MPRPPLLVIAASACTMGAAPAWAHGPCDCLTPASGPPGTTVAVATGAYKVVFNPDRTDLGIGPERLWRAHRRDVVPAEVFRSAYDASDAPLGGPVEFEVPAAPPGRYLVSVHDGSEGGAHYTWDHFRVESRAAAGSGAGRARSGASRASGPDVGGAPAGGASGTVVVIVGLAALMTGLTAGWLARGRRGRPPAAGR